VPTIDDSSAEFAESLTLTATSFTPNVQINSGGGEGTIFDNEG